MKAVISNRIYVELNRLESDYVKSQLTYEIPTFDSSITIRNFSIFRDNILTIPVGRTDLIPAGHEIVDKRVLIPNEFPEFKFTPRPSQQDVIDKADDNFLLNATVSYGKTFTALAVAGKFQQKTLVVVDKIPLMHQWAGEVKKIYGITPGLIGDGHDSTNSPITIGSVHSLYTRMDRLSKQFGTVICDEVHHAPSNTFTKVIDRSHARYKIGLSGTLERKDGKHVLIKDYFGHKVFKPPRENSMTPKVHVVDAGIYFPDSQESGWAAKITMLKESIVYQNLIQALTEKYMRDQHKVLVVSDRVEFLEIISKRANTALIVGKTKDREEELKKISGPGGAAVSGTLSIWKEGISHDPLSCVIMSTPINNIPMLEQLIGRIIRLCPGKKQPIVVDVRLRGRTVEKQFLNRLAFYRQMGWEVEYV